MSREFWQGIKTVLCVFLISHRGAETTERSRLWEQRSIRVSLGSITYVLLMGAYGFHQAALLQFFAHSFDPDHWVLFCHIMNILGKVIPVRLLKRSDGDRTPKHSIAAGLSTVLTILPASMSQAPATVNLDKSVMDRATNVIREGLNVLSPIAEVIPMAGAPLKASIDTLLVVLNSINVSQRIPEYLACVSEHSGRQGARIEIMLPT